VANVKRFSHQIKRTKFSVHTGFYVGGHVGYSRGNAWVTLADPDPTNFRSSFGSLTGGLQGGYNYVLPSRFLLGIEADASFMNALAADDVAWFRTTPDTDIAEKIDYMGTLRGRFGYAFDHWMVYATGGFAWSLGRFLQTPGAVDDIDKVLHAAVDHDHRHVGAARGVDEIRHDRIGNGRLDMEAIEPHQHEVRLLAGSDRADGKIERCRT
jgi:hypothetical protein